MFESVVAYFLNKYLSRYILDLDTENLNLGIGNGKLELTNLQLRPEALFELDLPIEVKAGYVGKITINIPWSSWFSNPFECTLEDVYVLAGPVTDRKYDAERESALINASKRKKLGELEKGTLAPEHMTSHENLEEASPEDQTFLEKLQASIINNIQVVIERVHIRYEDQVSTGDNHLLACGLILEKIEARTTNSQWQPQQVDASQSTIHKLVRLSGLSVYWNPFVPESAQVRSKIYTTAWRNLLKNSITKHRIMESDFDFILKPVWTTARLIFNKDDQMTLPKIIGDIAMDDIEVLISRQQFLTMLSLADSFTLMAVKQHYMKYSPGVKLKGHAAAWWHYAYDAVVGETIRPYSWESIKQHRQRFRTYKDMYKDHLRDPDDQNITQELESQENDLDLFNVVIAREQAKYEFAREMPERTKKKKSQGWWSWIWGSEEKSEDQTDGDVSDYDEYDTVVIRPRQNNLPNWLNKLDPEERRKLFETIGFIQQQSPELDPQYVAQKLSLKVSTFTLSLVNFGKEVLKTSVSQLMTSFENRPYSHGFRCLDSILDLLGNECGGWRTSLRTECFVVEGVSVEHELVPLITSDVGVFAPNISTQVFSCEFEKNPMHVHSDFSARLNIQPVEIVYDEHAVTEVIAFFHMPQISTDDVKHMVYDGLDRVVSYSRAGLQYAIEQHKTVHLSVNMRSPYVVIPEHGTLHIGGNVLVIDLGKLKVESELQPKNISLEELTMSEIESRLYDKFNVTVTEVKILLADSGDDWHTAQTRPDSEFHILPSMGLQVALYNAVQSQYKQLPKHKVEAKLSSLKFSLSDEKIQMLAEFFRHIPVPHSSSMMAIEDCVDGHLEDPIVPIINEKDLQIVDPSLSVLRQVGRSVHRNSVVQMPKTGADPAKRYNVLTAETENYYSASDHSDEEIDEWAHGLSLPPIDDHTSRTNTITVFCRFTLAEVLISVSKCADKIDTPYLMVRVDRLCADAAITSYGAALHASLGGVQLVDKIHLGSSGEYLELLGSKPDSDLISISYRKVDPTCPDFEAAYNSIEQGLVVKLSSIKLTFDRLAILYLNSFIQGLLISTQSLGVDSKLHRSTSTILSASVASPDGHHGQPAPSFIDRLTHQDEAAVAPPRVTKMHMTATMNDLEIKLCEHDNEFAHIAIKGIQGRVIMKQNWTIVQARLTDVEIQDLTENTLYPKILTLDDDSAIDLKYVKYHEAAVKYGQQKRSSVDGSIRMRIGRLHCVFLYKFISEIQNFWEPFSSPETVESYKVAAQQAVHNRIQDAQEQGTRVSLCLDFRGPTVHIPQNSGSSNVLVAQLGDLSLKNYFEDSEIGGGVLQHWDHMYLNLEAFTLTRGKLNLNGNVEPASTIIKPINLKLDLKRALPPHHTDIHYDLCGQLATIKVQLTEKDLKVMMAVLKENMTEISTKPDKVDEADLTPITDGPVPILPSTLPIETPEATTPVVEIEEPLLSAPEVAQLVKQTKYQLEMGGVILTLLTEGDDTLELATTPLGADEGDKFAQLEIGQLCMMGLINSDQSLDFSLTLRSLTLMDIRPDSNLAIKKLIRSNVCSSKYTELPPMVEFTYKQSPDGARQVGLNLDTVRINLCVSYMLSILNFFTDSLRYPMPPGDTPPPPVVSGSTSPTHRPQAPPSASVPQPLTFMGRFKQLEIILFAEPTVKHSKVLVLKANSMCDYFCLRERERMDAKVKQLQIISCMYGKGSHTATMVLRPCDLEFSRLRESPESEIQMEAHLSDVFLNISATTLHIALDVLDIIRSNHPTGPAADTRDTSLGSGPQYDLWHTKPISAEPWLQPEPEVPPGMYPIVPSTSARESLKVNIQKVQLMFEVENLDYHVPRLCVKSSLTGMVQDWSKQLRCEAKIHLEVSYFNEKTAIWEPLIEPVMMAEDDYRPWEVILKLVQAQSHPISCTQNDLKLDKEDDIDGEIHLLMSKVTRTKSDSSETETDEENEMTVIRPNPVITRLRHSSYGSYDSSSHHGSIQGESDSESELLSTISSTLDGLISSDSSDPSDLEEDPFDSTDKPVFLTSKGPVHVDAVADGGFDEVDNGPLEVEEPQELCSYLLIDSRDQLSINLTPYAMDLISEVSQTLTRTNAATLKSVQDLPGFEIYNQLDVRAKVTLSPEIKDLPVNSHWQTPGRTPSVHFSMASRPSCPSSERSPSDSVSPTYERFVSCEEVFSSSVTPLQSQPQIHNGGIHDVVLGNVPQTQKSLDDTDGEKLIEIEAEDDVDGISFLAKGVIQSAPTLASTVPFLFSPLPEDNKECYMVNKDEPAKERMNIKLEDFDELRNLSHKRAGTKLLPLTPSKKDTTYSIVYEVGVIHGRKVIKIRSPLQVSNHLTVPVELCCYASELAEHCGYDQTQANEGQMVSLTVLDPGAVYSVPLFVAYHCKLYVAPAQLGYRKCTNGIWWQDLSVIKEKSRFFACDAMSSEQKPFHFKVSCEDGSVKPGFPSNITPIPHYVLHLYPPVVLHNLLPYDLQFSLQGSANSCVIHGENMPLYTANLASEPKLFLQLTDYLGLDWVGSVELSNDLDEFKAITMETDVNIEGQNKQLSVGIHVNRSHCMDLYMYSPYWIINKTGLPVQIRGSRSEAIYTNDASPDPLLFRFKKHRKKKAKLRIYNSKWTRSFSLDTVASNGVVICHDKERNTKYQFLLQIQMSHLKLTKIVTIMPYFLVVNNTPYPLRYMEENEQADLWLDVAPNEVVPYWPCTDSMKMYVKHENSNVSSQHFYVHASHRTTLRMDKGGALCVEVTGGVETSTTIMFLTYDPGDAPVRVDNLCEDVFIKLHQKNQSQVSLLSPCQSVLYTWDDPTAERTLMWNVYNRKKPSYPAFISKDGSGEVQLGIQTVRRSSFLAQTSVTSNHMLRSSKKLKKQTSDAHPHADSSPDDDSDDNEANSMVAMLKNTRTDKVVVYWVSFLDGLQRVLLFTQDERIAKRAKKGVGLLANTSHQGLIPLSRGDQFTEAEQASLATFVSLSGVGLSLINSLSEEVAYISLMSAAPSWEVEVKSRWKPLSMELTAWLEQQWCADRGRVDLEDLLEADLHQMTMSKPFMGALRRVDSPALWLQYRRSAHYTYAHFKIHRLQVDNQLSDAYFTTVFYPTPLPSYVARKSGPKPFLEMAFMRRKVPQANIDTVKYAKLLVQEFSIRLDRGFLMSVYDVFADRSEAVQESEQLQADLSLVHRSLRDLAVIQAASRPSRVVFEYLHLSPLKLRVSFSMDGRVHSHQPQGLESITSDILDFFFTSIGATLTEIKDVELRMAYFERQGVLLTPSQLLSEIVSHYKSQAIQQAYVLLLGLDVLGNPYGLVTDFTQGLGDFFYEPFLGTIQEPNKFAESLVKGVKSLMGHTLGSLAGSASLITGSLGRALAVLSFDKDYRKRRQRRMQQRPGSLPESFLLAGKGFLVSVGLGISGVVLNPIRGMKEEGVEGFFKGVGKGLMGLITKPSGGAVDMVSMAFDGLRRCAEMGEDVVVRMRVPRYIHPDLGLKPYSPYQAMGRRVLYSLEKGRYVDSDNYWAHMALSPDERTNLALLTDKRVMVVCRGRLWADYTLDWSLSLADLGAPPVLTSDALVLKTNLNGTGVPGYNPFTNDEKRIVCSDQAALAWFQGKIEKAMLHLNQSI